jgi:hypothetical protein
MRRNRGGLRSAASRRHNTVNGRRIEAGAGPYSDAIAVMTALTEKLTRQRMTSCLADQTRGCDHDPSDECSYAAIQQDFMKDMSHDGLQLRYTLTKRWPQSVRKLITSMSFHFTPACGAAATAN